MKWEDITVFISSTFNDMHAERDYIIKNVFPQLEEWCENRRIMLRDIDLRWGIPPAKTIETKGSTIYKCLKAVDACRPFFLCFLGQRRGWVPGKDDINKFTFDTFPDIRAMVECRSHSATEYEIEHALLMPLAYYENGVIKHEKPAENAVFLRRKDAYVKDLTDNQKKVFLDWDKDRCRTSDEYNNYLRECKEANDRTYSRISQKNIVIDYECRWDPGVFSPELKTDDPDDDRAQGRLTDFYVNIKDLPDDYRQKLVQTLKSEFPENVPDSDRWKLKDYLLAVFALQFLPYAKIEKHHDDRYKRDAREQSIFLYSCLKDAVSRFDEQERIAEYCDGNDNKPLIISAEAGMGKTSLLAQFAAQYSTKKVVARFLGVSELSGAVIPLWDSILNECGIPPATDLENLRSRLHSILADISPCILLFDGLEQIPDGAQLLELLPVPLPLGIKVIFSIRSDKSDRELERSLAFHKDYPLLQLKPFTREQKEELIKSCLSKVIKELSPEMTELVCSLNESGNPLYLSILLNDIRSFGAFYQLEAEIRRYGSTPFSAFDAMLDRMENDYMFDMLPPRECVPLVFGLLGCARDGLSAEELTNCLAVCFPKASRQECMGSIQICLRQARAFLARRDGRTDFRHQAFRAAVRKRYTSRETEFHNILKNLFIDICDPKKDGSYVVRNQRALREYAWHLSKLSVEDYVKLYSDVCYINARCQGTYTRDLIREYGANELFSLSPYRDLLVCYRDSLEKYDCIYPSLLWSYGAERQNERFNNLRCPWIKEESDSKTENKNDVFPGDVETVLKVLADTQYSSAAFCFAKDSELAFAFTSRGQITAYDAMSMLPLTNPIYSAKAQPLGLCASNNHVAAAFDNDKIELYRYGADENLLHSSTVHSLSYLAPLYSGAAMTFDDKGRIWYQSDDSEISCFDISSQHTESFTVDGAEELSSICAYDNQIFGTACQGRGTLLFCVTANGSVALRDLGDGDSRVLCADENGCLVSCAAGGSGYPLILVNEKLETVKEDALLSPVTAALPLTRGYLLLPAKQILHQLWLWDGKLRAQIEQKLLYQDQASLCNLPDGSMAMISAGAITRFRFEGKGKTESVEKTELKKLSLNDLPDLHRYEIRDAVVYADGNYACAAGVSESMRSVQNEQCAGAVFLKRSPTGWRVCGKATWGRAYELIKSVCVDPENGRFTLLFRSAEKLNAMYALQGTAEELSRGLGFGKELNLPQNIEIISCCSNSTVFICAGALLLAYDALTLNYKTGLQLNMPVKELFPSGDGVVIQSYEKSIKIILQGGKK